ncbi:FAD-dependent oxidoreductase [Streptomyces iconiensis]|uniref:FAD-dependent oxidoreductase n=1 Tax=Streptomyces iconiensis TaxID=1384038 RepID=A0ABT7A9R1_9ACTN|nr:FAD-dependent oxidoreductase [Streptomyces iconiensis]MDJ1138094.1 FAD-dependent oxidoreductase [Streptomyces iconiensis]
MDGPHRPVDGPHRPDDGHAHTHTYDVVVIGSGAGGLAAAVTARLRGLSVLVLEKTGRYGGTTALSGGAIWVPDSFHLAESGLADSHEKGRAYLDATVGDRVPAARKEAYLAEAPRMVREFHDRTEVRFVHTDGYSDYYPERPGGLARGRSIEPEVFDFTRLPRAERALMRRAELPTYGLTITSYDFRYLNMVARTWVGKRTALKVGARAVGALLTGRRPLSLGEALIARLRCTLGTLGGRLWLDTPFTALLTDDGGRVTGVRAWRGGREVTLRARRGVVLASGSFARDQALREEHLPAPTRAEWSSAPEGNDGDGLREGLRLGAAVDLMEKVWGAPSVVVPGTPAPFFLVADRGIPGMLVVDGEGERYVNEAAPYHEFVDAMYAHREKTGAETAPSWLILDARSRARYLFMGLFPGQPFPRAWLGSGFVKKAGSVAELASLTGVPEAGLTRTVERFNAFARRGRDRDFGRGDSAYDRYYGDPTLPNPNLAELAHAPYYAVPVVPGDLGTKGGLVTDAHARVLREDGSAIGGLYATGNASAAVMGETYPGPGATIGPAMTFGYAAVNDMAAPAGTPDGAGGTARRASDMPASDMPASGQDARDGWDAGGGAAAKQS